MPRQKKKRKLLVKAKSYSEPRQDSQTKILPIMSDLLNRMKNQGATNRQITKQIRKAFRRYPETFMKFGKSENEFISDLAL